MDREVTLRPYQQAAVYSARAALASIAPGRRRSVLLVSPTGSGKTRIASEIVALAVQKGKRVLFLAHRTELIDQAAGALEARGLPVGVIAAGSARPAKPEAPVQVASVATLTAREHYPPAGLVILDEAHHGAAATFKALLDRYPNAASIGLTATPARGDGAALDEYSELVVVIRPNDLLELGFIVPIHIVSPSRRLKGSQIAQRPVDAWREHAGDRQAIVYAKTVAHAHLIAAEFGDVARVISADTPADERLRLIDGFRSGTVRVICNVAVLTEGCDFPSVSCVILARGFGTPGLYIQCAGRGSRPAPGKQDCVLVDLQGANHQHDHPYAPRSYSLEGRGILSSSDEADCRYCPFCGAILRVDPGEPCPECEGRSRDPLPVAITGDELHRYARMRMKSEEERAIYREKWRLEGIAKGYKPGWLWWKMKKVFG